MATTRRTVRAVWFKHPLVMLPGSGASHIGNGPQWARWQVMVDYTTREVVVSPPPEDEVGNIRVPLENVVALQLSSATPTELE